MFLSVMIGEFIKVYLFFKKKYIFIGILEIKNFHKCYDGNNFLVPLKFKIRHFFWQITIK